MRRPKDNTLPEEKGEADKVLIGPLLKDIGGPICKGKHKNT